VFNVTILAQPQAIDVCPKKYILENAELAVYKFTCWRSQKYRQLKTEEIILNLSISYYTPQFTLGVFTLQYYVGRSIFVPSGR
jgi:hypothetical protein